MFHKKRKKKQGTKTFEFKLRMNRKFTLRSEEVLLACQRLYNCAMEQRISVYHYSGKGIYYFEQSKQLTEARAEFEWLAAINRQIQEDVLKRVEKTYQAFFRRCMEKKAGLRKGKVGYPRFKAQHRYNSFSQAIEPVRGCPLDGDKLTVPGVGTVRVRLSRLITGTVQELRIIRKADGWYVHLICAVELSAPLPKTGRQTGVDVNLLNKATLSDGTEFPNPRATKKFAAQLKRRQQQLARKTKGSSNRRQARQKVARVHQKIARVRKDSHHKDSTILVRDFDLTIWEDLQILNLVRNSKLAKHIYDVGWSQFRHLTASKASTAGRVFQLRNPAYTSQTCSRCGNRQAMPLSERMFNCERCGLSLPRDQNAAINIEQGLLKLTPVERRTAAVSEEPKPQVHSLKRERHRKKKSDRRSTTLQLDLFSLR